MNSLRGKAGRGLSGFNFTSAAASVGLLALVSGCGKRHFGSSIPANQANTFRFQVANNPLVLDPATCEDAGTGLILEQSIEGLVEWGSDNKIHPALAASWDIKDGGRTYIFHLQKGVKFFDGSTLTANDVKFSLDRACLPAIKSPTASEYLGLVVGVQQAVSGEVKGISGVKVIDPSTVEIDLVKPAYYFLGDLAMPVADILSSQSTPADKQITSIKELVGTGPFIPSSYTPDQAYRMKSNPDYRLGAPKLEGADFVIVKDAATVFSMFKQNQIDYAAISPQEAQQSAKDPQWSKFLREFVRPGVMYLGFNQKVYPPFANRHVRRAFAMAIDTQSLCHQILGDIDLPPTGILPPGVVGYRPHAAMLPYDPAEAKKELALGGFSDGSQMPPLKLYAPSNNVTNTLVVAAIQSYLKKNLNVSISLNMVDPGTFSAQYQAKSLSMFYYGWLADYLDPQDFLNLLLTTNGAENRLYYSNPEVDQLCEAAATMPAEDPKRLAMYAKAEDIILQDAAWAPIMFPRTPALVSARVNGLEASDMGILPFNTVTLNPGS